MSYRLKTCKKYKISLGHRETNYSCYYEERLWFLFVFYIYDEYHWCCKLALYMNKIHCEIKNEHSRGQKHSWAPNLSSQFPNGMMHESIYGHIRSRGRETASNNYEQSEHTVLFSSDAAECVISCLMENLFSQDTVLLHFSARGVWPLPHCSVRSPYQGIYNQIIIVMKVN